MVVRLNCDQMQEMLGSASQFYFHLPTLPSFVFYFLGPQPIFPKELSMADGTNFGLPWRRAYLDVSFLQVL